MSDTETITTVRVTEPKNYTPEQLWNLDMLNDNDAGAATIGEFMLAMLRSLWIQREGFSGKRPLGNSGWEHQIYEALLMNEAIKGKYEVVSNDHSDYTEVIECDNEKADKLILNMIDNLKVKSDG